MLRAARFRRWAGLVRRGSLRADPLRAPETGPLGYILGYGAHCFELYGMRTWIVAFWTFVMARHPGASLPSPMAVSVVVTLLAMPASIWGNELSIRHGRHRAITWIQFASAGVALTIGLLAGPAAWALSAAGGSPHSRWRIC